MNRRRSRFSEISPAPVLAAVVFALFWRRDAVAAAAAFWTGSSSPPKRMAKMLSSSPSTGNRGRLLSPPGRRRCEDNGSLLWALPVVPLQPPLEVTTVLALQDLGDGDDFASAPPVLVVLGVALVLFVAAQGFINGLAAGSSGLGAFMRDG